MVFSGEIGADRLRRALGLSLLVFCLVFLFSKTEPGRKLELTAYSTRARLVQDLRSFDGDNASLDAQIVLVAFDDGARGSGWDGDDSKELLELLEAAGVAEVVVFHADEFFDMEPTALREFSELLTVPSVDSGHTEMTLFQGLNGEFLDEDGVLRSLPEDSDIFQHALALSQRRWPNVEGKLSGGRVYLEYLKKDHYARESVGRTPLHFLGVERLRELFQEPGAADLFRDRIILWGNRSVMDHRLIETPLGFYTAAEMYACLLNTIVQNKSFWILPTVLYWPLLLLALLLISLLLQGRRPHWILGVSTFLLCGSVFVLISAFAKGVVVPVVPTLLGLAFLLSLTAALEFVRAADILRSFGGKEDSELSGSETQASIFFTELPAYLMELERKESPDLLKCRREYNALLERVAVKFSGRVLDFQGDAQMVGFGLRLDDDMDHAVEATAAALEFVESCRVLAELWKVPEDQVAVHAGVCTGLVALGHVGAEEKQDIAAIGDTTNTAARLMGAAMKQDRPVIVAETTYEAASGTLIADELPPVELKGKSAPVAIYEAKAVKEDKLASLIEKKREAVPSGGVIEYSRSDNRLELVFTLLVVASVGWFSWFLSNTVLSTKLELRVYDLAHRTLLSQDADPRILIVGLDEKSESKLGPFPWSRGVYGQAIENLRESGYQGLFFDIVFRGNREGDPEGDRQFTDAVLVDPRVVLAGILTEGGRSTELAPPPFLEPLRAQDLLERGQVGLIHRKDDFDRVTRRSVLVHEAYSEEGRAVYPTAALALLLQPGVKISETPKGLKAGDRLIPSTTDGIYQNELLIRFGPTTTDPAWFRENQSYRYVHFYQLLDPEDPIHSELDGAYLMVGDTFSSPERYFQDRVTTPIGEVKGVEVHARTLDTLLNQTFLVEASGFQNALWNFLLGFGAVMVLLRYRRGKDIIKRLILLVMVHLVVWVSLVLVFGLWLRPVLPIFVIGALAGGILLARYMLTTRALARFVPAEVVDELLLSGQARDRRLTATVLLTDIRGYTTLSETRSAVQMLDVLNEYHKRTVACYSRFGGQALTYQGDAQIVVFGVFGRRKNPARDAVAAALELQKICEQLRLEWGITDKSHFDVGAGLCTGEIEVGFLGGTTNRQYSVVGETVRKSHKVQSLSEELEAPVILDQETYEATRGEVLVDDLGDVLPKGLSAPIRLYRAKGVGPVLVPPRPDEDGAGEGEDSP